MFLDQLFPQSVAYGMTGGPGFLTDVVSFVNGREQRNSKRDGGIGKWDAAHGLKTPDQMAILIAFFRECRGRWAGFRFHDWLDYQLTNELIGTGTGAQTVFNITKTYGTDNPEVRRIYKPASSSWSDSFHTYAAPVVKLADVVQGSGYTLDYDEGTVTFDVAPGLGVTVKITCEFHVPARFDTDQMAVAIPNFDARTWGQIPVIELVDPSELV
jgi:uncharacterized protein (TIGR02217 family)